MLQNKAERVDLPQEMIDFVGCSLNLAPEVFDLDNNAGDMARDLCYADSARSDPDDFGHDATTQQGSHANRSDCDSWPASRLRQAATGIIRVRTTHPLPTTHPLITQPDPVTCRVGFMGKTRPNRLRAPGKECYDWLE
jgi:hypothetical protein